MYLRCPLNIFGNVPVVQHSCRQSKKSENCVIVAVVGNVKFKIICSISSL